MNGLLDMILQSGNGAVVQQVAKSFGIDANDASKAIGQLLPGLSRGMQQNIAQPDGLEGVLKALQSGRHQRYIDKPDGLAEPDSINDGNAILGHLLGSKDASRRLAGQAAANTGLDEGMLKKMLPMVAAAMMGGMSKQSTAAGLNARPGSDSASATGMGAMLTTMLDADKDGSVVDDLVGMARKLF